MQEFVQKHCQDIVNYKQMKASSPFMGFSFDDMLDDTPIIFDKNGNEIPIEDILQMTFEEFSKLYPSESATQAFTAYMSAYRVVEGEALFREVQKSIQDAKSRTERQRELGRAIIGI